MVKRILAIVIMVCLLIGMVACGAGNNATTAGTGKEASGNATGNQESAKEGNLEPVTLDWYMAMWFDMPDTEKVTAAVSEKIKEKLNATVNFHVSTNADYAAKVPTMISAGQPMDMLFVTPDCIPYAEYAQRGAFYPLEGLMDQYAPNIKASLPKEVMDAVTIDGHIYAIVPYKDLADNIALLYDKVLCKKYNISVPQPYQWTTVYDLIDFMYAVKKARDQEYPDLAKFPIFQNLNMQYTFFSPYEQITDTAGITIPGMEAFEGKGSGDTVFNVYDTPEYLKYCQTMRKLVKDGIYPDDVMNFNKDKAINLREGFDIAQGELVANKASNPNYEISESKYQIMSTGYVRAMLNAVSANCKNPERALMVYDLVNTDPEIGTMLRFGIEGEHWKDLGDGHITFKGTKNDAEPQNRAYYHWYGAQWGSILNMKLPEDIDLSLKDKIKALVQNCNKNTALGFVFDAKPVQNEIAAVRNVVAEYNQVLRFGIVEDIEGTIKEFLTKLEENGNQKIIDEVQKQLTAWRASAGK